MFILRSKYFSILVTSIFLIFLSLLTTLVAQDLPNFANQQALWAELPGWIKEGVCIVYQLQAGVRTGYGAENLSASGVGYRVYLVTNIVEKKVYGIRFDYDRDPVRGLFSYKTSQTLLNVATEFLYMPLSVVQQALSERDIYAQYGVYVEGGQTGKGIYYFAITRKGQSEVTVSSYELTEEGIIRKATHTRQSLQGADAANLTLVGIYQIRLPKLSLPPAAKQSLYYSVVYGAYGVTVPWSQVQITPTNVEGSVIHIRMSHTGRISNVLNVIGNEYLGPHYINPELLKIEKIISIPDIGFEMRTAGYGQNGGIVVATIFENRVVAISEYDPHSGVLISSQFMDRDFLYTVQLLGGY